MKKLILSSVIALMSFGAFAQVANPKTPVTKTTTTTTITKTPSGKTVAKHHRKHVQHHRKHVVVPVKK